MTNKPCRRRCLYKDSCEEGYSCERCAYFTPTNSDIEIFDLIAEKEKEHFNDWNLYINYAETGYCPIDNLFEKVAKTLVI